MGNFVLSCVSVKLLGVNFDVRLNIDFHVILLLNKAHEKAHALA